MKKFIIIGIIIIQLSIDILSLPIIYSMLKFSQNCHNQFKLEKLTGSCEGIRWDYTINRYPIYSIFYERFENGVVKEFKIIKKTAK